VHDRSTFIYRTGDPSLLLTPFSSLIRSSVARP
jgi:hypothetical protein